MSSVTDTLRKISSELGSNRNILKNLQTLCQIRAPSEVFAQFDLRKLIQGIKLMKAQKSTEQLRLMVLKKLESSEKAVHEKENQGVVPPTEKPLQAAKRKATDEGLVPPPKKAAPPPPAALKVVAPAPAPVRRQLNLGQDQMMKNMAERHRQKAEAIAAGKLKAAATMAEHKRLQQERIREAQARKNGELAEEPMKQPKGRAKAPCPVVDTLRKISSELRSNRNILKNLRLLCLTNAPVETYLAFDLKKIIEGIKLMKMQKEAETTRKMVLQKIESLMKAAEKKENLGGAAPANHHPGHALKRKANGEMLAPPPKKAAPPPPPAAIAPAPALARRELQLGKDKMMKNMAERHRRRAEAVEAGRIQAAATMAEHKRLQQERIREAQARKNGEIVEEPKNQPKGRAKAPCRY
ncbi:unnamed protein product [Caenorhabditis brenneri]